MRFIRARYRASQPPNWPSIDGIAASLIYLGAWALIDGSSITIARVALLFVVAIFLANLGRFRLAETLPNPGLVLAIVGFAIGLTLLDIDGTTDPDKSWTIFGPWFIGGLVCAFFARRIFDATNWIAHAAVLPGIYLAMPLTSSLGEERTQYYGGSVRTSYSAAPVRRNVAPASSAVVGRGARAAGVAGGVAVAAGAAYMPADFGGKSNGQDLVYEEPVINPASGLPTVGGLGTPDVAMNSWCTLDHSCPDVFYEAPTDNGGGFSDFS
jgi:hypothetical protein